MPMKSIDNALFAETGSMTRRSVLKTLAASSVALVGGAALAACGTEAQTGPKEVTLFTGGWPFDTIADKATQDKDPLLKAYAASVDKWFKQNPGVKLKKVSVDVWNTEKLVASVTAGTAPDWYPSNVLGSWNETRIRLSFSKGMATDLTEQIQKQGTDKKIVDYAQPYWEKWKVSGKHYGVPVSYFTGGGMFYRRDWFKEAGIEEPKPDWTWLDVRRMAKAITKDKRKGIGLQTWMPGQMATGAQVEFMARIPSPTTNWHWKSAHASLTKEWQEIADNWRAMRDEDKSLSFDVTFDDPQFSEQFSNGTLGMFSTNSNSYTKPISDKTSMLAMAQRIGKPLEELVGFVSLPVGTNGAFGSTQPFVTMVSHAPRFTREKSAFEKAYSLFHYMYFGQGFIDRKKAEYDASKSIQTVFGEPTPIQGLSTIPGVPGSLEDAWGKKFMDSLKQMTEIPLVPNMAWYYPPEKNTTPTETAYTDYRSALVSTKKEIPGLLTELDRKLNQEAGSFTSSISAAEFKTISQKFYADHDAFWKQHAPKFHTEVFTPWYEKNVKPVIS